MHDKIKAILPKEKEIKTNGAGIITESNRSWAEKNGYRQALKEIHAKIPEIVVLVEGEVREKIEEYRKTADDHVEPNEVHIVLDDILLLLEALFSNKK